MIYVEVSNAGSRPILKTIEGSRCLVGKDDAADIVLSGWKVHKRHAEFFVSNEQIFLRDLGSMFGTFLKGEKVATAGPIKDSDKVQIAGFEIRVSYNKSLSDRDLEFGPEIGVQIKDQPTKRVPEVSAPIGQANRTESSFNSPAERNFNAAVTEANKPPKELFSAGDKEMLNWRGIVHERLIKSFDMKRTDVHRMSDEDLRIETEANIRQILKGLTDLPSWIDKEQLLSDVRDESIGLGVLEPLLADPTTSEIMVNSIDQIFVERNGKLERVPYTFTSDTTMMGIIQRIVAPVGRRIDESSPLVDARLKDGSRFNAIIPPLALKGPSMTIRKFSKKKLVAEDLIRFNSANAEMVEFLEIAVEHRLNVIVSGGTGSGKTTLLNILSNFIPEGERIVTIEDAAELRLLHENLVSLEARPSNSEGKGQISIRELVKNSLRMRPDRIVVGECRGGEALDMLQAMNTGHDGSLTTAHANSPRDMLARLEVMVLMAGMDLPVTAIREQVASAVDLIVQQTRFACGTRKITRITEITGVESGKIQLQDLFQFVETGYDINKKTAGYFTGCNAIPEFYEKLRAIGVPVNLDIFAAKAPQ
jgi:pilus assembly protein CpaF